MEMSFEKFQEYCCMQMICADDTKICCIDGTGDVECEKKNCLVFKGEENATV